MTPPISTKPALDRNHSYSMSSGTFSSSTMPPSVSGANYAAYNQNTVPVQRIPSYTSNSGRPGIVGSPPSRATAQTTTSSGQPSVSAMVRKLASWQPLEPSVSTNNTTTVANERNQDHYPLGQADRSTNYTPPTPGSNSNSTYASAAPLPDDPTSTIPLNPALRPLTVRPEARSEDLVFIKMPTTKSAGAQTETSSQSVGRDSSQVNIYAR